MGVSTTTTTTTPGGYGDLYDFNIKKSVEKYVRDQGFLSKYSCMFEDSKFDPNLLNQWIQFVWVDFGPTIFSLNTFHVRCFSRSVADRYGREREKMIGLVRNLLEIQGAGAVTFYDVMNYPQNPQPIQYQGEDMKIAIRFVNRSVDMDAEELGESPTPIPGVTLSVLTFNAHVARPHVIW